MIIEDIFPSETEILKMQKPVGLAGMSLL